jgi:hypothetical protein
VMVNTFTCSLLCTKRITRGKENVISFPEDNVNM